MRVLPNFVGELTETRSSEQLRRPEFSQPLVTALQIAIVDILQACGVQPQAVVGHSSGEIAAAYAAGLLSKEDAIRAAFYRGQAATTSEKEKVGMLAVGLCADGISPYMQGLEDMVQIACYNSPNSVTLSGTIVALEEVKSRLGQDEIFARLLQVDLAYHSTYMDTISQTYSDLLAKNFNHLPYKASKTKMYSSVLGQYMTQPADIEYWKMNMVRPVLFDPAVREMVSGKDGVNFLIEIGPSGALAGPISQTLKQLGPRGANIQYCTALTRGTDAIRSLYDVAGRLFMSGANINLAEVNGIESGNVIVDLPNYSWNHSIQYWYENESSKDWRNRLFLHHDLLGSKILGTSWHSPSFKKSLVTQDLSWLKDHKVCQRRRHFEKMLTSFPAGRRCCISGCRIYCYGGRSNIPAYRSTCPTRRQIQSAEPPISAPKRLLFQSSYVGRR
jgi:acyl transferase domain-containing protein